MLLFAAGELEQRGAPAVASIYSVRFLAVAALGGT